MRILVTTSNTSTEMNRSIDKIAKKYAGNSNLTCGTIIGGRSMGGRKYLYSTATLRTQRS